MRATLWENPHVRMLRVDGTIAGLRVAFQEPEGVDYALRYGRHGHGRGTLHGNPAFGDRRDTFHGAVHVDSLVLASPSGASEVLTDLLAVRRLARHLTEGTACAIYLLSPTGTEPGKDLVFAVRTSAEEVHDLDGVGALADGLEASLTRQLRLVAVPVGLSLTLTLVVAVSLLEPIVGLHAVIVGALVLAAFFGAALVGGRALFRARMRRFPARRDFAGVLRMDGWRVR